MKLFLAMILSLGLFTQSAAAAVDSQKIAQVAKELGKLLTSNEVHQLKPASPIDMMKELAAQLGYDEFYYDEATAMDTDGGAWGIIPMKDAIKWVAHSDFLTLDENGESTRTADAEKAAALVKSLYGTGVVFGAGPIGAVQCGVRFAALFLIDTEEGVIYDFSTEGSGC